MQAAPYGPSQTLPSHVDNDGDGWADEVEKALGSDPNNASSMPESQAVPGSCIDGVDNDLDGMHDLNDLEPEPSCGRVDLRQQLREKRFPGSGADTFPSEIQILDLAALLRSSETEECRQWGEELPSGLSLSASGPTVIRRGEPFTDRSGDRLIKVEIAALQATGEMELPNGLPIPFTILKKAGQPSAGQVVALQPKEDFPAQASFDVEAEILLEPPEGSGFPRRIPCIRKTMVNPKIVILAPYDDKNSCYQDDFPDPIARHCVKVPNDVRTIRNGGNGGQTPQIQPKYVYSAKFVCGKATDVSSHKGTPPFEPGDLFGAAQEPPVKPGNYATAINIHNPHPKPVIIAKKAVLAPREPKTGRPSRFHTMRLGPDEATEVDCPDIARMLGLDPGTPFAKGFEVIESPITLDVVAVYTQEVAKETVLDKITCRVRKGWGKSRRPPDPFVVLVQPPPGAVPDLAPGAVGVAYDPKPFCLEGLRKAGFAVAPGAKVKILDIDVGVGKGVGSSIDVEHIEPKIIEKLPPIRIIDP